MGENMKLLERMKHYNFWVALAMAVILLLNTLSKAFNFNIDEGLINDIIMAILGIMVVLGFVQKDNYNFVDTSKEEKIDENNSSSENDKEITTDESANTDNDNNIDKVDYQNIIDELKKDIENMKSNK